MTSGLRSPTFSKRCLLDEREIGNRDHPGARVARRVAEREELLEEHAREPALARQEARGRTLQRLLGTHEATR